CIFQSLKRLTKSPVSVRQSSRPSFAGRYGGQAKLATKAKSPHKPGSAITQKLTIVSFFVMVGGREMGEEDSSFRHADPYRPTRYDIPEIDAR
ncbi:MAG: hypothetical protein U1E27_03270, partial [Kiritimatiellia bacterium]|nr:hypothetical protein [Kiritimatiellia bacterium]